MSLLPDVFMLPDGVRMDGSLKYRSSASAALSQNSFALFSLIVAAESCSAVWSASCIASFCSSPGGSASTAFFANLAVSSAASRSFLASLYMICACLRLAASRSFASIFGAAGGSGAVGGAGGSCGGVGGGEMEAARASATAASWRAIAAALALFVAVLAPSNALAFASEVSFTRSASASFFALGSAALGPSRKAYASLLSGVLQSLHSSTASAIESTHSAIDTRMALLFLSRCGVDMQLVM